MSIETQEFVTDDIILNEVLYSLERRIYKLRTSGLTYREIGEQVGVSKDRCRQLYLKAEKKLKAALHHDSYQRLSSRLRNIMQWEVPSRSIEEIKQKLDNGDLLKVYGFSHSCEVELRDWLKDTKNHNG